MCRLETVSIVPQELHHSQLEELGAVRGSCAQAAQKHGRVACVRDGVVLSMCVGCRRSRSRHEGAPRARPASGSADGPLSVLTEPKIVYPPAVDYYILDRPRDSRA